MPEVWFSFFRELLSLIKDTELDCKIIAENIARITIKHLNSDFVLIEVWDLRTDTPFCNARYNLSIETPMSLHQSPFREFIIEEKTFMGIGSALANLLDLMRDKYIFIKPLSITEELKGIICIGKSGYWCFSDEEKLKLSFIAIVVNILLYSKFLKGKFERLFDVFNILQILLPIVASEIILEEKPENLVIDFIDKLKTFFDADRCIFVKIEHDKLIPLYYTNIDLKIPFRADKGIIGTVIQTGEPVLISDFQKFLREQNIREEELPCDPKKVATGMGIPIKSNGKLVGAVALCRGIGKPIYDEFDFKALGIFQDFIEVIFKVSKLREEKRRQEQLLNRAQRFESLGILTGGIAHDFNNILNVIIGLAEIAKMELKNGDVNISQVESYINSIIDQAKSASGLTRQILDFARKEGEHKQLIDLVIFIKRLLKFFPRTVRANISFEYRILDEGSYYIFADPTSMHQVIMNIVLNAVDAISDEGTITLTLKRLKIEDKSLYPTLSPGDYVVLEIADTGSGISEDIIDRIFDPFFTTKPNGTGLGLSQAYGIIKGLKGEILVESEVGKGTTFTIIIPEAKAEILECEGRSAEVLISSKEKEILIVEDRKELAQAISIALRMAGFNVDTVYSYSASLKFIENKVYDVIIADLMLPDGSGVDVVRMAKKKSPGTKAIIISGYRPEGITVEKINKHAEAFLSKPFTMSSLLETLKNVLEKKDV